MNRREFCQNISAVGGSAALASIIGGCQLGTRDDVEVLLEMDTQPAPTSAPASTSTPEAVRQQLPQTATEAEEPPTPAAQATDPTIQLEPVQEDVIVAPTEVAVIALVRTRDRRSGVARAIRLLELDGIRGKQVLLKPNFNSSDPAPGSTHPEVLRALLGHLNEMGAAGITVADRSGMGNTRQVMESIGLTSMAGEMGFDLVAFDELGEDEWVIRQPDLSHWSAGFPVPRMLLEAECVVQTCNLKTHRYGGHFTLSLKNSVGFAAKTVGGGGYNYMSELHNSPHQRRMIAEINTVYTPDLIVMDGVEAFVDGGPARGKIADTGVVLAGTDRVALDAVGVAILRMFGTTREVSQGPIFDQEQIARAVELGLGVDSPAKIVFATADEESESFAGSIRQVLTA